jgi:hypothetical protein
MTEALTASEPSEAATTEITPYDFVSQSRTAEVGLGGSDSSYALRESLLHQWRHGVEIQRELSMELMLYLSTEDHDIIHRIDISADISI